MVLQYAAEAFYERTGGAYPEDLCQALPPAQTDETGLFRLPSGQLIRELANKVTSADLRPGTADVPENRFCERIEQLAYQFHAAMAELIRRGAVLCRSQTGVRKAVLTGGVMQNTLLLSMAVSALEAEGFTVLRHHLVPPNDGGISLGQAYHLFAEQD